MEFKNLKIVLDSYAEYIDTASKNNMPSYYELKDKISFYVNVDGYYYSVEFKGPEYWKYANYGRGPGKMPPINVIEDWIIKRRIVPRSDGSVPITNRSLAFLIARKIGREGTKGSHFLEQSIEETQNYFEDKIVDAIVKDISDNLDYLVKPFGGNISI